ncbi:calcium-binding protein [Nocardioides humilatus]|uniref:Calcium-binding protein n=1 Tax=Nocardioides humilatus TaxID=2607660 RepID=A0A5B1LMT1_9ACTN|nr:calcium-binding protein [Nocardioides humilatus]KAA1421120.1 calcium-binding protein [Nocardioides humilatus]
MRGRAMLAAVAALLGLAVLATFFGVSGRERGAQLAAADNTCQGLSATIIGTDRADTIEGTAGIDVIVGRGGNDTIRAYGDNDVICGGAGDDKIFTGDGADLVFGDLGNDWVTSVAGGDQVYGGPGDETVDLTTSSDAPVTLIGDEGLDLLTLTITGTEPVLVDQAEQQLILGPEPDHAPGGISGWELVWLKGDHAWTYVGTDAPDSVIAIGGHLSASTYGGNDVVSAGGGDDIVNGGDGRRDVAAVIGGANACAETEWGDCEQTVTPPGVRPVLRQPRSWPRAASTLS